MKAIYPGTFDPITLGHIDIIKRSLAMFDSVMIAIVKSNTSKKILFSDEMRLDFAKKSLEAEGIKCEIRVFDNLLVDFAKLHQCGVIIRGLRVVSDFDYEFQLASINSKLNRDIQTVFLPAGDETHFISSTFAKNVGQYCENGLKTFIHKSIVKDVYNHINLSSTSK